MSQFIEMFKEAPRIELGKMASFINGSAFKPEEWSSDGLPIVRIQNLTQDDSPYNYYDGDTTKKIVIDNGDMLVSWSATLGVFLWSKGKALLNQHIFKVSFDKLDVNKDFFVYAVKLALDKMSEVAHGSTMRHVVKKDFNEMIVANPSINGQESFALIAKQADKSGFDGLKSQFIEMFKHKKPNGKIADLVDANIKSVKKSFNKEDMIEYIDISSVNAKYRTLNETTQYIVASAPSRAQQCVQNGDILVSTVRPINRNVAVVNSNLTNLVASTGFCVLRPIDGYREYLLAIVTSDKYTEKMCDIASGGLYPAVNNSDVLSYDIFIPDKDFLHRVTQIYQQADKSGSVLQHMIAC